ncbi:MAG: MlaD family protein [Casimicrobiaceae bacterium]
MLYFNESLRGLSVDAPVTILGLPIGEVTDLRLDIDPATGGVRGCVEIVVFPEQSIARLKGEQSAPGAELLRSAQSRKAFVRRMVERGLRAQLQTGSPLTGQRYRSTPWSRSCRSSRSRST